MEKKIVWKGIVRVMIPFIFVTVSLSPFFQSCQKERIIEPVNVLLKSATTVGTLTYFTTPEEFPCPGLPTEDFEEAYHGNFPCSMNPVMQNPLDKNTNNGIFSTGDILSGISIKTSGTASLFIAAPCFVADLPTKVVYSNSQFEYLIIDFTDNNVTNVSMTVLSYAYLSQDPYSVQIRIFGNSGLLGTTSVIANILGTYFGVQSTEPITKIELIASAEAPGVDNIAFGTCVVDSDSDGCLDSDDAVPNSNMEEFVKIDGCSNGVPNRMTLGEPCGTMMSDMIDVLEAGTYKNSGQFVKAVTQLTKMWMDEGLITQAEQTLILACAGKLKL